MDFTPVSDIALEHAIVVGKAFKSEIMLLHIIGSKKEMTDARLRMEAWNEKAAAAYPHTVRTAVRIGSIFEDIDDVAVDDGPANVTFGWAADHEAEGAALPTDVSDMSDVSEIISPIARHARKPTTSAPQSELPLLRGTFTFTSSSFLCIFSRLLLSSSSDLISLTFGFIIF